MANKPQSDRSRPTALFRLDREMLEEIERIAGERHTTKTACYLEALGEWLKKQRRKVA